MIMQPEHPFYLFGMGNRDKYIYQNGRLSLFPDKCVYQFDIAKEQIFPDKYEVHLLLKNQKNIRLYENEIGFFIEQNGFSRCLTESVLQLPDFKEHPHQKLLRILHHEILFSIYNGKPYPNIFVYDKPWYRDGAMIAMVLEKTGNLSLIKDWILSLNACFDRNNGGNCEPDNIGQALYLISLLKDVNHPLINELISEAHRLMNNSNGLLCDLVDGAPHPVYSAKWLKFGLSRLGFENDWVQIPAVPDDYSPLFWMAYRDQHVAIPYREYDKNYPYLWWAEQHFYNLAVTEDYLEPRYPATNETNASEADYEKIRVLSEVYADGRNASPHTWHAAEMFLYLIDIGK